MSYSPDCPGDVSLFAETYLTLKLLGMPASCGQLRAACSFIYNAGVVARVRVLTPIFFAQFGLTPWAAVPQLLAELILLLEQSSLNIYTFQAVARHTIILLLIVRHYEPIYALPNGKCAWNNYLDELWPDPLNKMILYGQSWVETVKNYFVSIAFKATDTFLFAVRGFRWSPTWAIARNSTLIGS